MTRSLPILPLRDIVVFPHRIVPLFVGREKSVAALEAAMAADKELFLVAQLDPSEDDPDRDALYDLGVIATAMQLLKLPDGTVRVLVEGVKRARLVDLVSREDYAAAEIEEVDEESADELQELAEKIRKTRLSKEARSRANAELKKLRAMAPMSAEATVARNYLDVLLALPWGKKSKLKKDIAEAQRVLDEDHYGLEKVKDRIVEYLAVQARTNKLKGPILCLVGPPGVGKTSLGRSIARATGREFVRQSLGGVRDEAEIRGHRRTYIGSLPGKIISNIKKAGTSNPLFLLDEIDKLGQDFRGDPSSALLEVLDPEQNNKFQDHYLELDYDLSDVMFVCTANSLNLPQPLLDRMEIIRLEGYTEDEKVEIAKAHLRDKQIEAHGLKPTEFELTDEGLRDLIRYYTREAGVRTLEREIAKLARKALRRILEGK